MDIPNKSSGAQEYGRVGEEKGKGHTAGTLCHEAVTRLGSACLEYDEQSYQTYQVQSSRNTFCFQVLSRGSVSAAVDRRDQPF